MADLRIVDAPEIPTNNITGQEKLPTGGNGNYSISLDSVANYTKTKKDLTDNTSVDNKVNTVRQELNVHTQNLSNPHQVTKAQIGLGNVDNTADLDKPVSNSTQAAIISAVVPKADKTYVDSQLSFKADKADVYTKQESSNLVNNSISTALTPVNDSLYLAKRGVINRYDPLLTYNSGERVILTNGDIVKSTVNGNVNDPHVNMTGWVKDNSASQILDASGKTQQELNNLIITPFHFGAIGDGAYHPLSERYATLTEAQEVYPEATSLSDSIDGAALQKFFNFFKVEKLKTSGNATGTFYITKPIVCEPVRHTTFYGTMKLVSDHTMTHMINFASAYLQWRGEVYLQGRVSVSTLPSETGRNIAVGCYLGRIDGSTPNSFQMSFDYIECIGFKYDGVVVKNWAMFLNVRSIRNSYCGARTTNTANWSNRVDGGSFDFNGTTTIDVSNLPPIDILDFISMSYAGIYVLIGGEVYTVTDIDRVNSRITVKTKIDLTLTSGTLTYVYGSGVSIEGSNTSGYTIGKIQNIICGIGFNQFGLYGGFIGHLSSEACVIARKFGEARFDTTTIGTVIASSYFEANNIDTIVTTRSNNPYNELQNTNQSLAKTFNTNAHRLANNTRNPMYSNINESANIHKGMYLYAKKRGFNLINNGVMGIDVTNPHHDWTCVRRASVTFSLITPDLDINRLYGYDSITVYHVGTASNNAPTSTAFTPPAGYTVNGSSTTVTFNYPNIPATSKSFGGGIFNIFLDIATKNFVVSWVNSSLEVGVISNPASLAANTSQTLETITLAGVVLGDHVSVSFNQNLNGTIIWGEVTANDTVTVYHFNPKSTVVDVPSGSLRVKRL